MNSSASWYRQPRQLTLLEAERREVRALLNGVHGHAGLEYELQDVNLDGLSSTAIMQTVTVSCVGSTIESPVSASLSAQPFCDASARVVIVHHVHEGVADADELFAEWARIVSPGGLLVLIGFGRPLAGLRRITSRNPPRWIKRRYSQSQLQGRLTRLGLNPVRHAFIFRHHLAIVRWLQKIPFGGLLGVWAPSRLTVFRKPAEPGTIERARDLVRNARPATALGAVGLTRNKVNVSRSCEE